MNDRNGTIIGVGSALVDRLAFVPESFLAGIRGGKGGMELVDFAELSSLLASLPGTPENAPGGSAANTVMGLARLGAPAGLLAKVGRDGDGDFYLQAARDTGLATTACKRTAAQPTGQCLSLITPDGERTMRTFLGAAGSLAPEEISPADFAGAALVHIEGYLLFNPDLLLRVLAAAKQAGAKIALDLAAPEVVQAAGPQLATLLADWVDIVFANETEATTFAGTPEDSQALRQLAALTELAVVKRGPRGALVRRGHEEVDVPAWPIRQLVDTTGAGDAWAAGFLFGLGDGMTLAQAGRAGAIVAAEVVQTTGASLPAATWNKLRAEIKQHCQPKA